jgi:translocation and assembly module TamB
MRWRKIVGWIFAISLLFLLSACIAGYFFLKSAPFNQFARRKIAEATQRATGAATAIGSLDFNIPTLTAHLDNITLRGREQPDRPPLLMIGKLTVGLNLQSLIHRKIDLKELVIEHPVAHLEIDSSGESNLPAPPPTSGSHVSIFQLAVQHAQLIQGEVTYNNKKSAVEADLYNLRADVHFDRVAVRYSGSISYENGQLRYGGYAPLPHSLRAAFNALPEELSIESANLSIGRSTAWMRAVVRNYSDPTVEAKYNIAIDARDFASLIPAYRPSGDLSLAGHIRYRNVTGEPISRCVAVDGQFAGESLAGIIGVRRIRVSRMRGSFQFANGTLQAKWIRLDTLGGSLNADLKVRNLDSVPSGQLRASLHGISLEAIERMLSQSVKQVALAGTMEGTIEASWSRNIRNIRVRSDLDIAAEAKGRSSSTGASSSEVPVTGVIHATYEGARNAVTLHHLMLGVPAATLTAEGEVSHASRLQVAADVSDLQQLESIASTSQLRSSQLPPISGSATFSANIKGSFTRPLIQGRILARNLEVQSSAWRTARATFQAGPSHVTVTDATLVSAQRGSASFGGSVDLRDWHYFPNDSITADISVRQMSIGELQHLANFHYPFVGILSCDISVRGTELHPEGSGKVQITGARAYDEPLQNVVAQFHAEKGTIVSSLDVTMPAGTADGYFSYTPASKAYIAHLSVASLLLQKLQFVQAKKLPLAGIVSISASGQGTIDNPQLNASLRLPQISVQGKSISDTTVSLLVANHKAALTLISKVVDSSVQARAQIQLAGDFYTEASIDTTVVPLNVLLATYYKEPAGFTGQTEVHATLKGPLHDTSQVEAHITIPTFRASYQSIQIGIASPLHADFAHSVLTLQPAEIRGSDTSVRVQGSIPFAGHATSSLTAEGTLDASILKIFSPDTTGSGTVSFNVHASGSAQNPEVNGRILIHDVALLYTSSPIGVSKLNGTLDVAKNSVQISRLTGEVGGGDVVAGGSIVYRPKLQFNLLLQGKSVRLLYPAGLRTMLDSNLSFIGNEESSTVTGRVLIDSLGFTPDFDLSTFAVQFSNSVSLPPQPAATDNIKLDVSVQSKENLAANSSQISLDGGVNVRVIGTVANPVITGRTDLTSGEVFYRNVRYQIQRGIVTFDNPTQTNPVLNISATTTIQQYNLTLKLSGPFDKLTTSYTSDPPLATADIINLLAQGQTTEQSAAAGQSTDSIIASQAAGQFVGGIQKLAGISSLSIDPLIGGNNQNPTARIAVQQRVTKNFLFTFSTDVSQPGQEIVQGDYQINQRWSVNVTRDQVGGISVGGELHTKF